jgi:hypothetical protein
MILKDLDAKGLKTKQIGKGFLVIQLLQCRRQLIIDNVDVWQRKECGCSGLCGVAGVGLGQYEALGRTR